MANRTVEAAFLSDDGAVASATTFKNKRQLSRQGEYWNAVRQYAIHGKTDQLDRFRSRRFTVDGQRHRFVTDLDELDRGIDTGELHFTDFYADQDA